MIKCDGCSGFGGRKWVGEGIRAPTRGTRMGGFGGGRWGVDARLPRRGGGGGWTRGAQERDGGWGQGTHKRRPYGGIRGVRGGGREAPRRGWGVGWGTRGAPAGGRGALFCDGEDGTARCQAGGAAAGCHVVGAGRRLRPRWATTVRVRRCGRCLR